MFAIAVFHLADNDGDCGSIDLRLLHERRSPLDIVGINRVEEVFYPPDFREPLQHQRAFEVRLIHHAPPCENTRASGTTLAFAPPGCPPLQGDPKCCPSSMCHDPFWHNSRSRCHSHAEVKAATKSVPPERARTPARALEECRRHPARREVAVGSMTRAWKGKRAPRAQTLRA